MAISQLCLAEFGNYEYYVIQHKSKWKDWWMGTVEEGVRDEGWLGRGTRQKTESGRNNKSFSSVILCYQQTVIVFNRCSTL